MSASIIQKKAAFATVTGAGSVAVTLDSPISAGSLLVIAAALVQSDGSVGSALSTLVRDNFNNAYGPFVATSSGQGFFADTYVGSIAPATGAQSYTLSFTALTGQNADTFLAGISLYEVSGATSNGLLSASQSLSGLHEISDLSATLSTVNDGSFGHLIVGIFAGLFTGSLTDAQAVAAGSGWTLDGRQAASGSDPMCIVFESQFVGPNINPAATFSGNANNTELDGTILVVAYALTAAIASGGGGGGNGGGGGGTPSTVFLGSVTEVGSDADDTGVFLGTVSVISQAPSGAAVPYLGKVKVVTAPAGRPNPTLGQVIVIGSAPTNQPNEFLGEVATS